MNNLQMSDNVKQHFIHALKSLGLGRVVNNQYAELSEKEIAEFLDNPQTTPQDIFNKITLAVNYQLKVDEGTEHRLQQYSVHERHVVNNALNNEFQIDKQVGNDFLKDLCSVDGVENYSTVARVVIEKIKKGIDEQKDFKKIGAEDRQEKASALDIWDAIRDCEYDTWLTTQPDPQNPQLTREEYYQYHANSKYIKNKTKALFHGDANMAQNFLNSKFNDEALACLKVNESFLDKAKENCKKAGKDPEKDLTVGDVLLTVTDANRIEQVMTYFHTRSKQQDEMEKSKKGDVTRANKIGNVLGKNGRKEIKNSVVYFDKEKIGKQGKKAWRGYKEIYAKIEALISSLSKNIMAGGHTIRALEAAGYVMSTNKKDALESMDGATQYDDKPWEIDEEQTPPQLVQNQSGVQAQQGQGVAEKFYEKARARLLADKMRIHHFQALLAEPTLTAAKEKDLKQKVDYLTQRIQRSENAINQIPDKNDNNFNNQNYYDKLEEKILAEKQYEKDVNLKAFIDSTKNNTANAEMSEALSRLKLMSQGKSPNKINAKRNMAVELFNLQNKTDQLTANDIDELTDRFVANKMADINQKLTTYSQQTSQTTNAQANQQTYQMSFPQALMDIKDFVREDLKQNAMHDQYLESVRKANQLVVQNDVAKELG